MYPIPPFPAFAWPLFQHIGPLRKPDTLLQMLQAAAKYPASRQDRIKYLIEENILPPNYRSDSGKKDPWRDYGQILSELGLIYPVNRENKQNEKITPTPLGLNFLDKILSFEELLTLQAFRYQYPNGHKVVLSDLSEVPV